MSTMHPYEEEEFNRHIFDGTDTVSNKINYEIAKEFYDGSMISFVKNTIKVSVEMYGYEIPRDYTI